MQLFTAVATMFLKKSKTKIAHENMKKPPSIVTHKLFAILQTGSNPAQITFSVP